MDRTALLNALGSFPERVPLNREIVGSVDRGSYDELRVEYDVERGERIAAYLLKPKVTLGRLPAVICHHQHHGQYDLGKSEVVGLAGDPSQAIGSELAALGYIILAPDAIGFEERNWSYPTGWAEYFELSTRLVQGQTLLAKCIHDAQVAVDLIESDPDVDPLRIGFAGHSYGGRMAIWAPALDERIKASVSNCGCVNLQTVSGPRRWDSDGVLCTRDHGAG